MLDNVKDFISDKASSAATAVGDGLENTIQEVFGDRWHSFTQGVLLKLVIIVIAIVLITTLFDSIRRIIRGLDVAAIGGLFFYLGCKVPDVVLLRELIKPLKTIGLILFGVGVVLFIVFKVAGALAKKGKIKLKSAIAGKASAESGEIATSGEAVAAAAPSTSGKGGFGRVLAVILALALGIGGGIALDRFVLENGEEEYNTVTIEDKVTEIAEMAALKESYTAQQEYKGEAKQIFGKDIPFTSKEMQLIFSGEIKAGPNMEKANIKVDPDKETITVILPHSEILSHEIDEDSIQLQGIKNGLFNRVTPENTNEVRKTGKEGKEKEVLKTDFLEQADQKAVSQLTTFLQAAYPKATIKVEFK